MQTKFSKPLLPSALADGLRRAKHYSGFSHIFFIQLDAINNGVHVAKAIKLQIFSLSAINKKGIKMFFGKNILIPLIVSKETFLKKLSNHVNSY